MVYAMQRTTWTAVVVADWSRSLAASCLQRCSALAAQFRSSGSCMCHNEPLLFRPGDRGVRRGQMSATDAIADD